MRKLTLLGLLCSLALLACFSTPLRAETLTLDIPPLLNETTNEIGNPTFVLNTADWKQDIIKPTLSSFYVAQQKSDNTQQIYGPGVGLNYVAGGKDAWIITNSAISLQTGVNYRVSLDIHNNGKGGVTQDRVAVLISSAGSDKGNFSTKILEWITPDGGKDGTGVWYLQNADFTVDAAGSYYFAIHVDTPVSDSYDIYFNNLKVTYEAAEEIVGGEEPEEEVGGEEPEEPGTGGETPEEPGTGGETPEEPGTGGEEPEEPGTGGEEPEEPGTGGETPEEGELETADLLISDATDIWRLVQITNLPWDSETGYLNIDELKADQIEEVDLEKSREDMTNQENIYKMNIDGFQFYFTNTTGNMKTTRLSFAYDQAAYKQFEDVSTQTATYLYYTSQGMNSRMTICAPEGRDIQSVSMKIIQYGNQKADKVTEISDDLFTYDMNPGEVTTEAAQAVNSWTWTTLGQSANSVTFQYNKTYVLTIPEIVVTTVPAGKTPDDNVSVETLTIENARPEYYNLQGVRVNNPERGGIYIVRTGSKTQKVMVK